MLLQKAKTEDIPVMMEIVRQAQASLKAMGINQWQNNYPNVEVIQRDIDEGYAYVLTDNDTVIAMLTIIFNDEPTYDRIYEGEWLSRGDFVVVHRIAIDNRCKQKGIASYLLGEVEKMAVQANISSFKIDTHKDNIPMRKTLDRNDFSYCGRIVLPDGNSRVAYEKLLI